MFKKSAAILLTLVFFALILAGCGSNSKNDQSKEVKLVWYTIGDPPKEKDKVIAKLNEYLKQKINATVEIHYIGFGDYDKKMKTIASSGEKYDLAFTCSWSFNFRQGVSHGYFVEIDPLLDEYGKDAKAAINPLFWEGTSINGKHYAVPCNKEIGTMAYFRFNKGMLDKYGLDVSKVTSIFDLAPVLAKAHQQNPELYLFTNDDRFQNYDFIVDKRFPGAIRADKGDLKVVNQFEDPDALKIFKIMREYYLKGYVRKDIGQLKERNDFDNGRQLCDISDAGPDASETYSKERGWPVTAVPSYPTVYATTGTVSGSMIAVSATSENPERAMMFLNLLNTDPVVRNMINYGLEGEHYTKVDANTISRTKDQAAKYSGVQFTLGNLFILYNTTDQPKTIWEDFKKFNQSVKPSPALGFSFDSEPVKNEVAALNNLIDEYSNDLMLGTVDVDSTISAYMKKAKEAGLDKVLAEMQKQLDAWKATKK